MPEQITQALEVLATVMIYAVSWFIGFTSIMGVPAVWRKIKKMADKEKKAHEEIIVKRAEKITELDKERTAVSDEIIKLREDVLKLKEQKALSAKEIKDEKKEAAKEASEPAKGEKAAQEGTEAPTGTRKATSTANKKGPKPAPA
jgi:uncharacterized protein YlxW (UPF0749 family)